MTTPTAVKDTGKPARPATDPTGPTGRLATWVAKTALDDVPASVRDRAKHLVLDGIGCALVGAQLPWSRIGVEGVTALDSAGDSALIGWDGRTTSATSAAMVNSSFIQGFELDDYHPLAPLHSNSLVLPAMLAAAPRAGRVSGERFLLGAILGYETGPRVGQALGGLDMLSRGWHSGVVFGPPAAAAAAGTLYGLDAAGFEDAFGMAATQSCGLMSAMYESMVKRMQHGFASRNGLTAAALAAATAPTPKTSTRAWASCGRPSGSPSRRTRAWDCCTPRSTPPSSCGPRSTSARSSGSTSIWAKPPTPMAGGRPSARSR
jgi:aconitate decarboxylase